MKVDQYTYLSPEAVRLRRRDATPPWGVHPCEVDSITDARPGTALHAAWTDARRMRELLERAPDEVSDQP